MVSSLFHFALFMHDYHYHHHGNVYIAFSIYLCHYVALCLPFVCMLLDYEKVITDTRGVIVKRCCCSSSVVVKRLETHTLARSPLYEYHVNVVFTWKLLIHLFIYSSLDYHFKQTIDNENNLEVQFMSNECFKCSSIYFEILKWNPHTHMPYHPFVYASTMEYEFRNVSWKLLLS